MIEEQSPLVSPPRVNVLGVGISVLNLGSLLRQLEAAVTKPGLVDYVTVTGVHGVIESLGDSELKKIHNQSFLSTPDGMPMVWLGRQAGYQEMDRVYGPDVLLDVAKHSARNSNRRHFFYGGSEGVALELTDRLRSRFPGLQTVGTFCPPFRKLTEDEEEKLVAHLQATRPHYLWVGLSTPKQERFMHDFVRRYPDLTSDWGHGMVLLGVGAAFDFHTGRVRQAPVWVQRSGFEWLYRMMMEPRRLFKRYFKNNFTFLGHLFAKKAGWQDYPMSR